MVTVGSSRTTALYYPFHSSTIVAGVKGASSSTISASDKNTATAANANSSGSSGIPQAVITAIQSYVAPTQQAWTTLTQTLKAGDISSAQTALSAYNTALSVAKDTMAAPSAAFSEDLTTIESSLKAGDLTSARAAFANATADRPSTAAEDVYWSQSRASLDGWITVYGMEHHAAIIGMDVLASDIADVDKALREEGAYITAALKSQGYDSGTASHYGSAITGIDLNQSEQQNNQVDETRAARWIKGLITSTQGKVAPLGYSDMQSLDSDTTREDVSNELSSILFANAANSGRLLQSLIDHTSATSANLATEGLPETVSLNV